MRFGYARPQMRILFVTSNRVGDAVLSTGLLDHLIRRHPDARITIACGPHAEGVFARMPRRERTLVLDKQPWNLHWLPLWGWAAARRWDLVVDIRGSALSYMVRTAQRAVMRPRPGRKTAQLAALLGLDPPPLPVAWTNAEDRARAAALLPARRPVIALGPTANWLPKVWPAERFAALFRIITAELLPDAVPAVFAGPGADERAMAAPLIAALPDAIDLVGRLSLPEAAACLARAALYVGNDSGLMHLAAAAGCPTLGLFGPTPVEEYAPAGRCTAAVVAGGPSMLDLTVADTLAAAAQLLQKEPTPALVSAWQQ
ncbi:MAG TPA: glycosyltransferase family 9 protein [Acetobacteraceae bacterium]|nr:glycosyltransferase family 9 protein [Acetobacteraceae bacterium]